MSVQAKLAVTVSTRRYEASHGKAPRGRGLWLFESKNGRMSPYFSESYGKAKALAVKWAQEEGISLIYTCP